MCAGDVTVGEKGIVKSNISARDVIIAGSVHGNINTKGKLAITSTGSLHGNTTAVSFIIDEGGVFQGTSKMDSKQDSSSNAGKEADKEGTAGSKPFGSQNGYNGNSMAL